MPPGHGPTRSRVWPVWRRWGLCPCAARPRCCRAPEGTTIDRWPLFGTVSETWYAKPDAGKLMVSPADEDPVDPHDAWPDDMVLAEGLDRFEQATTVSVTRVEHRWAGLRTFAPDRTPVAGFDPRRRGFLLAGGAGRLRRADRARAGCAERRPLPRADAGPARRRCSRPCRLPVWRRRGPRLDAGRGAGPAWRRPRGRGAWLNGWRFCGG